MEKISEQNVLFVKNFHRHTSIWLASVTFWESSFVYHIQKCGINMPSIQSRHTLLIYHIQLENFSCISVYGSNTCDLNGLVVLFGRQNTVSSYVYTLSDILLWWIRQKHGIAIHSIWMLKSIEKFPENNNERISYIWKESHLYEIH